MVYFRLLLDDNSLVYLESKHSLSDKKVIKEAIDQCLISIHDKVVSVVECEIEEFEENSF